MLVVYELTYWYPDMCWLPTDILTCADCLPISRHVLTAYWYPDICWLPTDILTCADCLLISWDVLITYWYPDMCWLISWHVLTDILTCADWECMCLFQCKCTHDINHIARVKSLSICISFLHCLRSMYTSSFNATSFHYRYLNILVDFKVWIHCPISLLKLYHVCCFSQRINTRTYTYWCVLLLLLYNCFSKSVIIFSTNVFTKH